MTKGASRPTAVVAFVLIVVTGIVFVALNGQDAAANEPPEWLVEEGRAALQAQYGDIEPRTVDYLINDRGGHIVVYDFGRWAECRGCSIPGDGMLPRSMGAGFRFEADSRRLTASGTCTSVEGCRNALGER